MYNTLWGEQSSIKANTNEVCTFLTAVGNERYASIDKTSLPVKVLKPAVSEKSRDNLLNHKKSKKKADLTGACCLDTKIATTTTITTD
jgi:hypothetical protein